MNANGLFNFDPSGSKGAILNAASSASTTNTTGLLHAKLDKTGCIYFRRSYGTSSAVGVVDMPIKNSLRYTYEETTFAAHAKCSHDASMIFSFDSWTSEQMHTCRFNGFAPDNQRLTGGPITGWLLKDLFAWGVSYNNQSHSFHLAAVAGAKLDDDPWKFAEFNATQCRIDFMPQEFEVHVDNVNKIITATANPTADIAWPDFMDALLSELHDWISNFTATDGELETRA